jgi:alkylated DNA repair dioxygenase AlkB
MARRKVQHAAQSDLFAEAPAAAIDGWIYQPGFLTRDEEAALLGIVAALPLHEMQYKEYTARRRGLSFGGQYDYDANRLLPSHALAPELEPLRDKVAAWLGVRPDQLIHALVSEYRPGTPLGWHRDAPNFEAIAGVSLASDAVLQFRPYEHPRSDDVIGWAVEPRSIYVMRGAARWQWQHRVLPTDSLRYSITFRTARARD